MTVYDGIILMKDESGLWSKVVNKFTQIFKTNVNSKDHQRERGVILMLPDYIRELELGAGLNDLMAHISAVERRQSAHLQGYPGVYYYNYYDTGTKEREAQQILRKVKDSGMYTT